MKKKNWKKIEKNKRKQMKKKNQEKMNITVFFSGLDNQ